MRILLLAMLCVGLSKCQPHYSYQLTAKTPKAREKGVACFEACFEEYARDRLKHLACVRKCPGMTRREQRCQDSPEWVCADLRGLREEKKLAEIAAPLPAPEAPQPNSAKPQSALPEPSQRNSAKPQSALREAPQRRNSKAQLVFESETGLIEVHVRPAPASGTSDPEVPFRLLCTAPCRASLPPGRYEFALARGSGALVEVERRQTLGGRSVMQVDLESRASTRAWGAVLGVVGALTSTFVIAAGRVESENEPGTNFATVAGHTLGISAAVAGLVLIFQPDEASLTRRPTSHRGQLLRPKRQANVDASQFEVAPGLSFTAHF